MIAEMEDEKNRAFVDAAINLGYKRADVHVALARSFGNEEVHVALSPRMLVVALLPRFFRGLLAAYILRPMCDIQGF